VITSFDLDRELGVFELRASFLEHTRRAYAMLPPETSAPRRILDIGCGTGAPSIELARLSGGTVVGIDIDQRALEVMRGRITQAGLGDRVTATCASLDDTNFPDAGFDLIWEEGVLHLLDADSSLTQCRRLLEPGGYLVMHETNRWFDTIRDRLPDHGFALRRTHPLPKHYWLTAYAEPLEANLRAYLGSHDPESLDHTTTKALATHRQAVASIQADPDAADCAFYISQKVG
jgi:ubiquinone/menaquinone biosynthesis C-methylase UbiE